MCQRPVYQGWCFLAAAPGAVNLFRHTKLIDAGAPGQLWLQNGLPPSFADYGVEREQDRVLFANTPSFPLARHVLKVRVSFLFYKL